MIHLYTKFVRVFRPYYIFLVAVFVLGFLGAASCDGTSSPEAKDKAAVARQMAQYGTSQPIPGFTWSLERDIVIQLYQARNEKVATHTVWRSDTGVIEGDCPSIGYPVPYDTSLTNPLKVGHAQSNVGVGVLEQAEPNGIYASKNSIATWVRCVVRVNGKPVTAPIYIESRVTAYPFPVVVNYVMNRAQPVENAEPTVTIKANMKVKVRAPGTIE